MRKYSHRLLAVNGLILFFLLIIPAWAGLISTSQEIEIGRKGAKDLEKKYGTVSNPQQNQMVNRIGQSLASQGSRGLKYTFKILASKEVNALAFPGGFICVTEGILKQMPENQLAFVMGHEVSHVEKKHSVKSIEQQLYSKVGGAFLLSFLSKGTQERRSAATLLSAANTVAGSRYSQEHEREADHNGMILMSKAGYDPHYAIAALQTLQKLDKGKDVPGFLNSLLGSHPLTKERIKMAEATADEIASEYYHSQN